MYFNYNNKNYEIIIEKKKIKNMYLKIKEDLKIYISCNKFISNKQIETMIKDNYNSICKMINTQEKKINKNKCFLYLGKEYDVVILDSSKNVSIINNKIFTNNINNLDKWLKNEAENMFLKRLDACKSNFKDKLPNINLKIRTMKTRWGVCNRLNNNVTLNFNLIKYNIEIIDYVIYHELCHFVYPNHSKNFWNLVSYYVPNWKKLRNDLKY